MKNTLALILLVFGIVSCSKEISSDQLVKRNGITYEVNSQTPFNGRRVSYYDNGQLRGKGSFKDGELNGPYESYYENGQLMWKRNFKDGKLDGLWEEFDEEGNLTKTEEWKDGELIPFKQT